MLGSTSTLTFPFAKILTNQTKRHSPFHKIKDLISNIKQYHSAVLREIGKPLVLQETKRRSLEPNEVRIAVHYCGINSLDINHCIGDWKPKLQLPIVPGYEVSGEVIESCPNGAKTKECFSKGQKVIGLQKDHVGGFAEEIILDSKDVWEMDVNNLSLRNAGSLVNSYATALLALTRRSQVDEGDTVLVTGASGRLGLAVLDLAANVYRCKVIAVCDSEIEADLVKRRGATAVILRSNQNSHDLVTKVKNATGGKGVEVIIDTLGGDLFKEELFCLGVEGKLVVVGFASKKIQSHPIKFDELLSKSFSILDLEHYRENRYEVYHEAVTDVIEMCEEKIINPAEGEEFLLANVNDALTYLKNHGFNKKAILKVIRD